MHEEGKRKRNEIGLVSGGKKLEKEIGGRLKEAGERESRLVERGRI